MIDLSPLQPLDEDWERALAVVAHPDDMEYGAASVVARWVSQGKEVAYLLITRGEAGIDTLPPDQAGPLRAEEERRSAQVVGVSGIEFLDYPDGQIEYGTRLRRDIARAIRRHRPHVLFSNSPHLSFGPGLVNSADHRAVGLATIDAAYDAANRWIFPELLEEGLAPWAGVRMICVGPAPQATHGVDVTDFFHLGVASLREHAAYLEAVGMNDPEPLLRRIARMMGPRLGCELAVAVQVLIGPGTPPGALMPQEDR